MKSGRFSKPKLRKLQLLAFRSETALGHLQTWQEALNCQACNRRDLYLGDQGTYPSFPSTGFLPQTPTGCQHTGIFPCSRALLVQRRQQTSPRRLSALVEFPSSHLSHF